MLTLLNNIMYQKQNKKYRKFNPKCKSSDYKIDKVVKLAIISRDIQTFLLLRQDNQTILSQFTSFVNCITSAGHTLSKPLTRPLL